MSIQSHQKEENEYGLCIWNVADSVLFIPYNSPPWQIDYSHFNKEENWGSRSLTNFPKAIQLVSSRTRTQVFLNPRFLDLALLYAVRCGSTFVLSLVLQFFLHKIRALNQDISNLSHSKSSLVGDLLGLQDS